MKANYDVPLLGDRAGGGGRVHSQSRGHVLMEAFPIRRTGALGVTKGGGGGRGAIPAGQFPEGAGA